MKSNTAASLAALCAVVYGSSVLGAPVDGTSQPPPNANNPGPVSNAELISNPGPNSNNFNSMDLPAMTSTMQSNAMSKEDAAIWAGIRHGVKDGLEQALASELMVSTKNNLIRDEEVDQVLDCIGDDSISKMATCIKNEHLAIQAIPNGQEISEEEHSVNIQKCISDATLEHVEYCVGKLEIQRLGEDAHIYQELYNESQLKDKEYLYEHPPYSSPSWPGSKQSTESQMVKATDPLFRPSWYEMHKSSSNGGGGAMMPDKFNNGDLLAKTPEGTKPYSSLSGPSGPGSAPSSDANVNDFKADMPSASNAKMDTPPISNAKMDMPPASNAKMDMPSASDAKMDMPSASDAKMDTPPISNAKMDMPPTSNAKMDMLPASNPKGDLPFSPDAKLDAKVDSTLAPDSKPTNSTAATPDLSSNLSDLSKNGSINNNNSTTAAAGPDAKAASIPLDDKKDGADVPLVKRKFGYGPEWQTAAGTRDLHPLPRRDLSGEFAVKELEA